MANYRNTNDLKIAVLQHCGELTNGNSTYDASALTYVDNLHRDLLAGGNEFGVDTAEPWVWAKAHKPIILTLETAYENGSVTLTNGSFNGSFSIAPAESLAGWFVKIEARDEYFKILAHTAGATAFQIDQPYTEDSGSLQFKAIKLDYEIKDDNVLVNSANNRIDFSEAGTAKLAVLPSGLYSASDYISLVATQMQASSSGGSYAGSFDSNTRLFTITASGVANFAFLFASGLNASTSGAYIELGFDQSDTGTALTFTSIYPLNAIQRLIRPMTMYRDQDFGYLAREDAGKIYGIDFNTMSRKYPMVQMCAQTPDRFCEIALSRTGILTVRFSSYPSVATRVEVDYIPCARALKDNQVSCPLVPQAYRDYLVFGATYYLMVDKSDDRAQAYAQLAEKKLMALVNNNRKKAVITGNNYGRLIPRGANYRRFRVHENGD